MRTLSILIVVLTLQCAGAASVQLAFDLNRGKAPLGSEPRNLMVFDSVLYFTADDGLHGRELWRSDGTASGTFLAADLVPGPKGIFVMDMRVLGRNLSIATGEGGNASLYILSPGQQRPERIARFSNATIYEMQVVSDRLFFSMSDPEHGSELWTMDGAIPRIVRDIMPGADGSNPYRLYPSNGLLFFYASDSTHGSELWRSDGTEAGTHLVRDIAPGAKSSGPVGMISFAGKLLFVANDGTHGNEIWKTDGTEQGTSMVRDLHPGAESGVYSPQSGPFALLANYVYFVGQVSNEGYELWKLDAGLRMTLVRDIAPTGRRSDINFLLAGSSYIFFSADDPAQGISFWRSDGTPSGTVLLVDPYPTHNRPYLYVLRVEGDRAAFITWASEEVDLWVCDGTTAGTRKTVSDLSVSDAAFQGNRLFVAMGPSYTAEDIFVSDPWQTSPKLVKSLRVGNASSSPEHLTPLGKSLYFTATDEEGPGIWRADGTKAQKIYRGNILRLARTTDSVFFVDQNRSLFKLSADGHATPIDTGVQVDDSGPFRNVGSQLVFTTYGGISVTSGSGPAHPIYGPTSAIHFELLGQDIYTIDYNQILWRIELAHDKASKVFVPRSGQRLGSLRAANGLLYFTVSNGATTEFWSSQGTSASTRKLGATGFRADYIVLAYPHWFFAGSNSRYGNELRVFNIMTRRVSLVKDIVPGTRGSHPRPVGTVGSVYLFTVDSTLWRSDATEEGTFSLGVQEPECPARIGANLYFTSPIGDYLDVEPHITDTSEVSTIADVYRGPYSSEACDYTLFQGAIYFAATDARHGRELWRIR